MGAGGMAHQDESPRLVFVLNEYQGPLHLAGHLRQRDGGQQAEADGRVGRAGAHEGLGGKGLSAPPLALPGAAVDEYQDFFSFPSI